MQLFSADAIVFSKTIDPENTKKPPSKVVIIGPQLFFMYWPGCPNGQETEIPYHQKPLTAGLGISTGVQLISFCPISQNIFQESNNRNKTGFHICTVPLFSLMLLNTNSNLIRQKIVICKWEKLFCHLDFFYNKLTKILAKIIWALIYRKLRTIWPKKTTGCCLFLFFAEKNLKTYQQGNQLFSGSGP